MMFFSVSNQCPTDLTNLIFEKAISNLALTLESLMSILDKIDTSKKRPYEQ